MVILSSTSLEFVLYAWWGISDIAWDALPRPKQRETATDSRLSGTTRSSRLSADRSAAVGHRPGKTPAH